LLPIVSGEGNNPYSYRGEQSLADTPSLCKTVGSFGGRGEESGQLSLDLDQDLSLPPMLTSAQAYEQRRTGHQMLRELARAIGEHRAELDLALFRRSLTENMP
jgi:hypothetical protein